MDPNILQTAFVANMDVLMRAKAAKEGTLGRSTGIPDLLFGGSDRYVLSSAAENTVEHQNIINNGSFAFVKGELSSSVGVGYTGGFNVDGINITPEISYKVIDVCNPANETLVRMAVTEIAGPSNWSTYSAWLNKQGIDTAHPHYCVVAKITFFADIIVPYSTEMSRNLYSLYTRETVNEGTDFFQINVTSESLIESGSPDFFTTQQSMISGITGNPYFTYTTYFAILP